MLWSFPALSLLLFTPLPTPSCSLPCLHLLGPGVWWELSSFSPKSWLFILQIPSRALVQTLRWSLSGLPAPLTLTLTWALVLQALCLLPCLPWRRFRWSCSVLTSGRGSMTLEPRWSSPKQAGKDKFLCRATFEEQENKCRSCYIFLFTYLWCIGAAKATHTHFSASGCLDKVLFLCLLWFCYFPPRTTQT